MHAHDGLEHRADGVDVSLLAALLSASRVQDVAAVQDQEQHVHLRRLQALLTRAVLNQTQVICHLEIAELSVYFQQLQSRGSTLASSCLTVRFLSS